MSRNHETALLTQALAAWSALLGSERVHTKPDQLKQHSANTFARSAQAAALLQAKTTEEVQAIVHIANMYRVPLYPISRGKNWGFGSAAPTAPDSVVLDLSGLDRILDYNEELAYITVEPGCTFQAVRDFLQEKNSALMLNSVAASPDASLIGNTLERGHTMGLYCESANHVCGLEVVLPNSKLIQTGFLGVQHSKVAALSKWGVGPNADGLFLQSNLGIVCQMTFWLKPKPAFFQQVTIRMKDLSQAEAAVDKIRQLRLGGLQISLRLFNDFRLISATSTYPFQEAAGAFPLPENLRIAARNKLGISEWMAIGGLYTRSKAFAQLEQQWLTEQLAPLVEGIHFSPAEPPDQRSDQSAGPGSDLMLGGVSAKMSKLCYWRIPAERAAGKEVHAAGCGVIWFSHTLPCTGTDLKSLVQLTDRICRAYGYEPNLGFQFSGERVLDVTGAILFDREAPGQDEQALACHDELAKALCEAGYSPYRLGLQSMNLPSAYAALAWTDFLHLLKSSVDPNWILAPGRYVNK